MRVWGQDLIITSIMEELSSSLPTRLSVAVARRSVKGGGWTDTWVFVALDPARQACHYHKLHLD